MVALDASVVSIVALGESWLFTLLSALSLVHGGAWGGYALWLSMLPIAFILSWWWRWFLACGLTSCGRNASWLAGTLFALVALSSLWVAFRSALNDTFFITSILHLSARWVSLAWCALAALSGSWVALGVWLSASGGAESCGVAIGVGSWIAFLASLGVLIALRVGYFSAACLVAT